MLQNTSIKQEPHTFNETSRNLSIGISNKSIIGEHLQFANSIDLKPIDNSY
jgi:dihydropteroate synthase